MFIYCYLFIVVKLVDAEAAGLRSGLVRYEPYRYLTARTDSTNKNFGTVNILSKEPFIISLGVKEQNQTKSQTVGKKLKKKNRKKRDVVTLDKEVRTGERRKRCKHSEEYYQRKKERQRQKQELRMSRYKKSETLLKSSYVKELSEEEEQEEEEETDADTGTTNRDIGGPQIEKEQEGQNLKCAIEQDGRNLEEEAEKWEQVAENAENNENAEAIYERSEGKEMSIAEEEDEIGVSINAESEEQKTEDLNFQDIAKLKQEFPKLQSVKEKSNEKEEELEKAEEKVKSAENIDAGERIKPGEQKEETENSMKPDDAVKLKKEYSKLQNSRLFQLRNLPERKPFHYKMLPEDKPATFEQNVIDLNSHFFRAMRHDVKKKINFLESILNAENATNSENISNKEENIKKDIVSKDIADPEVKKTDSQGQNHQQKKMKHLKDMLDAERMKAQFCRDTIKSIRPPLQDILTTVKEKIQILNDQLRGMQDQRGRKKREVSETLNLHQIKREKRLSQNLMRYGVKKWIDNLKRRRVRFMCAAYADECYHCVKCEKCPKECRRSSWDDGDQKKEEKSIESEILNMDKFHGLSQTYNEELKNGNKGDAYSTLLRQRQIPDELDLQLYRDRARKILESAEDILRKIKESEDEVATYDPFIDGSAEIFSEEDTIDEDGEENVNPDGLNVGITNLEGDVFAEKPEEVQGPHETHLQNTPRNGEYLQLSETPQFDIQLEPVDEDVNLDGLNVGRTNPEDVITEGPKAVQGQDETQLQDTQKNGEYLQISETPQFVIQLQAVDENVGNVFKGNELGETQGATDVDNINISQFENREPRIGSFGPPLEAIYEQGDVEGNTDIYSEVDEGINKEDMNEQGAPEVGNTQIHELYGEVNAEVGKGINNLEIPLRKQNGEMGHNYDINLPDTESHQFEVINEYEDTLGNQNTKVQLINPDSYGVSQENPILLQAVNPNDQPENENVLSQHTSHNNYQDGHKSYNAGSKKVENINYENDIGNGHEQFHESIHRDDNEEDGISQIQFSNFDISNKHENNQILESFQTGVNQRDKAPQLQFSELDMSKKQENNIGKGNAQIHEFFHSEIDSEDGIHKTKKIELDVNDNDSGIGNDDHHSSHVSINYEDDYGVPRVKPTIVRAINPDMISSMNSNPLIYDSGGNMQNYDTQTSEDTQHTNFPITENNKFSEATIYRNEKESIGSEAANDSSQHNVEINYDMSAVSDEKSKLSITSSADNYNVAHHAQERKEKYQQNRKLGDINGFSVRGLKSDINDPQLARSTPKPLLLRPKQQRTGRQGDQNENTTMEPTDVKESAQSDKQRGSVLKSLDPRVKTLGARNWTLPSITDTNLQTRLRVANKNGNVQKKASQSNDELLNVFKRKYQSLQERNPVEKLSLESSQTDADINEIEEEITDQPKMGTARKSGKPLILNQKDAVFNRRPSIEDRLVNNEPSQATKKGTVLNKNKKIQTEVIDDRKNKYEDSEFIYRESYLGGGREVPKVPAPQPKYPAPQAVLRSDYSNIPTPSSHGSGYEMLAERAGKADPNLQYGRPNEFHLQSPPIRQYEAPNWNGNYQYQPIYIDDNSSPFTREYPPNRGSYQPKLPDDNSSPFTREYPPNRGPYPSPDLRPNGNFWQSNPYYPTGRDYDGFQRMPYPNPTWHQYNDIPMQNAGLQRPDRNLQFAEQNQMYQPSRPVTPEVQNVRNYPKEDPTLQASINLQKSQSKSGLMQHMQDDQMSEKDLETIQNMDDEVIDQMIEDINKEQAHAPKVPYNYEPECSCVGSANNDEDVDKYEIVKGFLHWVKDMHLNRVLID